MAKVNNSRCPIIGKWCSPRVLPITGKLPLPVGPSFPKRMPTMADVERAVTPTLVVEQGTDNPLTFEQSAAMRLFWSIVREKELHDEGARITNSVLAYLAQREADEHDPWVRDDIRISWITVLNASEGNPIPHICATYAVIGLHPDKVWPAIQARREYWLGKKTRTVRLKAKEATA